MSTQVDKKIHDLRSYLGLSLKAFGDAIDYTGTHILRIEQKAVNPSEQFIQKVCEGLHVDPEYFTGEMPVEQAVTFSPSSVPVHTLYSRLWATGWASSNSAAMAGTRPGSPGRMQ